MPISSYGDISQRTAVHAMMDYLDYVHPRIILNKFGQTHKIPKNKAQTIKMRRPVPFAVSTVPIVEGVTPNPHGITYEDVQVSLAQYGDLAGLTDVVQDLSEDPVLQHMVKLSGENAAAVIEQVTYGVVRGGTNVIYANGANRAAVNTKVTLAKQRAATKFLARMKARKITEILSASPNIGTEPVEAAYVAVCHTDLGPDIRDMPGFVHVSEYGNRKPLCDEELGSVDDVRYVLSEDLAPFINAGGAAGGLVDSTGGANADVYPIIIFGKEAFGTTPLKGSEAARVYVHNPDQSDKADPIAQRGFVGWKAYFAALILNQAWLIRMEVAATKL
jgi:N4-gp56 family major capsid protein